MIVALFSEAAETARSIVPSLTETFTADIRAPESKYADVSQKKVSDSSVLSPARPSLPLVKAMPKLRRVAKKWKSSSLIMTTLKRA